MGGGTRRKRSEKRNTKEEANKEYSGDGRITEEMGETAKAMQDG